MTLKHKTIDVSSSPTHLTSWNVLRSRSSVIFQNVCDVNIFIGNSSVSTDDYGFRLLPEQTLSIELAAYEEIYAVSFVPSRIAILVVED
jgi:hypothetical protein